MKKKISRLLGTVVAAALVLAAMPSTAANADGAADFEANGFVYGSQMGTSGITFNADVKEGSSLTGDISYTIKTSATLDGDYNAVDGVAATTDGKVTLSGSQLVSGNWYLIEATDATGTAKTEAVQALDASWFATDPVRCYSNGQTGWYLSNGAMAYQVVSSGNNYSNFNAIGRTDDNSWIGTSFGKSWTMNTTADNSSGAGGATLDKLQVGFLTNDVTSGEDAWRLEFTADLAEGQNRFGFGCDTQLANRDFFTAEGKNGNLADGAALQIINSDNKDLAVLMVGAHSLDEAEDDDAAFVIGYEDEPDQIWIGNYSSRVYGAHNTASGSNYDVDDNGRTVACYGVDSGMTTTWENVEDKVSFYFSVGTVASTGAHNIGHFSIPYERPTYEGTDNDGVEDVSKLIASGEAVEELVINNFNSGSRIDVLESASADLKKSTQTMNEVAKSYMLGSVVDTVSVAKDKVDVDGNPIDLPDVKVVVKSDAKNAGDVSVVVKDAKAFAGGGVKIKANQNVTVLEFGFEKMFKGAMKFEKIEGYSDYTVLAYKNDGTVAVVPCLEGVFDITFNITSDYKQVALVGTAK